MPDRDLYELEEVLHEFASEPVHDAATLDRYLRANPSMTEELVDLSLDLRLRDAAAVASAPDDEAWLDASWSSFQNAMAMNAALTPVADPFAALSPTRSREVRSALGGKSGVLQGFRSRIVDVATVPDWVLRNLARELGSTLDNLRLFLMGSARLSTGLSFKADDAPEVPDRKISFEQLLIDAGVEEEDRTRLLTAED